MVLIPKGKWNLPVPLTPGYSPVPTKIPPYSRDPGIVAVMRCPKCNFPNILWRLPPKDKRVSEIGCYSVDEKGKVSPIVTCRTPNKNPDGTYCDFKAEVTLEGWGG